MIGKEEKNYSFCKFADKLANGIISNFFNFEQGNLHVDSSLSSGSGFKRFGKRFLFLLKLQVAMFFCFPNAECAMLSLMLTLYQSTND
jgi:hypothetical protein